MTHREKLTKRGNTDYRGENWRAASRLNPFYWVDREEDAQGFGRIVCLTLYAFLGWCWVLFMGACVIAPFAALAVLIAWLLP